MRTRIRLTNFLIDSFVFFLIALSLTFLMRDYLNIDYLKKLLIIIYYLYYFIFEASTGQTVGKMVTKTIVVDIDDHKIPKLLAVLLRTLCRLIPFDFISYFFTANGIHDQFSKTKLIYK